MKRRLSNPLVFPVFTLTLFAGIIAVVTGACAQPADGRHLLDFAVAPDGGFTFDTGVLQGRLRAGGKSVGLSSVIAHGTRLDRSQGLLSHYRVFTVKKRYGAGAWDWPSEAKLIENGTVEVHWPAADRPFEMWAVYRILRPTEIEVTTRVKALRDLPGFESFLASYFSDPFTNALAWIAEPPDGTRGPRLMPADKAYGDWQMFPRDASALSLINDGRWQLEPNPVTWTVMPELARPIGVRRNPASGLTALLVSSRADCFAVSMPHQTEGHYSMYLSLFGRDLKAGQPRSATARLIIEDGRMPVETILNSLR